MRPNFKIIMKKVFSLILLSFFSLIIFSCSKTDDTETEQIRDFTFQHAVDQEVIKTFLKTHSINVVNHPGFRDDQNISFTEVPALSPSSIWGTDDATHNANLLELQVEKDYITYTCYYIQLREGSGPNSKSPCNYDNVLTAYQGFLMDANATSFETNNNPQDYFNLAGVIRGWSEIFPKFKTGSYVSNPDGTVTYTDFGAGVMFIPSGLGYYNVSRASIPAYSPLIFGFKLYEINRVDNDNDGIYSYLEDRNGDGYLRDNEITYEDDTDHDGTPDFLDTDDDGDNYLTKKETEYLIDGVKYYYPFQGVLVDDPLTPQNETLGIPSCGATPDYTSSNRLRKHLDPSCH